MCYNNVIVLLIVHSVSSNSLCQKMSDEMRSILEVGSEQLLENGIKTTGSSIVQMKILSFLGYIRKIYKAFLKIIPRYLLSAP